MDVNYLSDRHILSFSFIFAYERRYRRRWFGGRGRSVVIGSCKLLRMAWLVAINNAQIAGRRAYQSFSFLTGKGAFLHATDVYSSGLYGSSRMFNRFWRGWISFFKRIRFSDEWGFAYQHIIGPITDLKRCPWFALQLSPILGIVKINLHDAAAACTSYLVQ